MIALATAMFLATAQAGDWSKPKPYAYPIVKPLRGCGGRRVLRSHHRWVSVAGSTTRYEEAPHWFSNTRAQAAVLYGYPSEKPWGGDVRLGSFMGPDTKLVRGTERS